MPRKPVQPRDEGPLPVTNHALLLGGGERPVAGRFEDEPYGAYARAPVATIRTPSGVSEIGMILKLAMPSGIPIIVRQSRTPVTRWPSASHHPATIIQTIFPTREAIPAWRRDSISRPNGQSTRSEERRVGKECRSRWS